MPWRATYPHCDGRSAGGLINSERGYNPYTENFCLAIDPPFAGLYVVEYL
jgi:hypothetical protein